MSSTLGSPVLVRRPIGERCRQQHRLLCRLPGRRHPFSVIAWSSRLTAAEMGVDMIRIGLCPPQQSPSLRGAPQDDSSTLSRLARGIEAARTPSGPIRCESDAGSGPALRRATTPVSDEVAVVRAVVRLVGHHMLVLVRCERAKLIYTLLRNHLS